MSFLAGVGPFANRDNQYVVAFLRRGRSKNEYTKFMLCLSGSCCKIAGCVGKDSERRGVTVNFVYDFENVLWAGINHVTYLFVSNAFI